MQLSTETRQANFFWTGEYSRFAGLDRIIADVQNGRSNSLEILSRAGSRSEIRGRNWNIRTPVTKGARDRALTRSRQTYQELRPYLQYIQSQIVGFRWRPSERPEQDMSYGCVQMAVELGEDRDQRHAWRSAQIEIVGRLIKVCVYDAAYDWAENCYESLRLEGSILVVDTGKNSSGLERVAEYVAALAVEGREPNRHWRRSDYEAMHHAEIRTIGPGAGPW